MGLFKVSLKACWVLIPLTFLSGCSDGYVIRGLCGIELGEEYDSRDAVCLRSFSFPDVTLTPKTKIVACICIERGGLGEQGIPVKSLDKAEEEIRRHVQPLHYVVPERIISIKHHIEPEKYFGRAITLASDGSIEETNGCVYDYSFTFKDGEHKNRKIVVRYKYRVIQNGKEWRWYDEGCRVSAIDDVLLQQLQVERASLDAMAF